MKNQIQYIVDEVLRPADRKLVILMTSTHPMTDRNLALTGHEIYNLDIPQFPIKWTGPVPDNVHIIQNVEELPHRPDVIISQNVVDQYQIFKQLSYTFDAPLIEFEHTVPTEEWIKMGVVDKLITQIEADGYVFITDYSRKEWKRPDASVLYHMVDTDHFKGWTGGIGKAAIMCNAFSGRKWAVGDIEELLQLDIDSAEDEQEMFTLFGHNPGYNSRPLSRDEIPKVLGDYDVFVNTSIRSPIPASLLEAASIGMPIVSRETCAIPDFFTEGENIRYFKTNEECVAIVEELLKDKAERKRLGAAARKVILDNFNKDRYVADWNKILEQTIGTYHNG